MKKNITKLLKFTIIALIFIFILLFIKDHVHELDKTPITFHPGYLIASIAFNIIFLLNLSFIWTYITKINGCALNTFKSSIYWMLSEVGKYIPSKIFLFAGRLYFYHQEGKSKMAMTFSFYLEVVCSLLAAMFIFLASILSIPCALLAPYKPCIIPFLVLLIVSLHPKFVNRIINLMLKIFRKAPSQFSIRYRDILKIVTLYILNYYMLGLSFYLLIRSFYSISLEHIFYLTGANAVAGIIGILSLFAPSGLGVREGILILTLRVIMPNAMAGIVALIARIWASGIELFLALAAFILAKRRGVKI